MRNSLKIWVKGDPIKSGAKWKKRCPRASAWCTSKTVQRQKLKGWLVEWWSSGQSAADPVWETITESNKQSEAMKCSLKHLSISALLQICQASFTTLGGSSTLVLSSFYNFPEFQRIVKILGSLCGVKTSSGFHEFYCASIAELSQMQPFLVNIIRLSCFAHAKIHSWSKSERWRVNQGLLLPFTLYRLKVAHLLTKTIKLPWKNFQAVSTTGIQLMLFRSKWDKSWRNASCHVCPWWMTLIWTSLHVWLLQ